MTVYEILKGFFYFIAGVCIILGLALIIGIPFMSMFMWPVAPYQVWTFANPVQMLESGVVLFLAGIIIVCIIPRKK